MIDRTVAIRLVILTVLAGSVGGLGPQSAAQPQAAGGPGQANTDKWEKSIAAFEKSDQANRPPQQALLFVGSSSIRGWDLNASFPDRRTINRGFGGSELADVIRYADRIILPYNPRVVVVYAGDNDIAHGKSAATVFADYQRLTRKIHAALPETRIVFIAIKPSLKRWKLVAEMRHANEQIRKMAAQHAHLDYVDIDTPMIGEDGKPRGELFKQDGLHLNRQGYALWAKRIRPYLR